MWIFRKCSCRTRKLPLVPLKPKLSVSRVISLAVHFRFGLYRWLQSSIPSTASSGLARKQRSRPSWPLHTTRGLAIPTSSLFFPVCLSDLHVRFSRINLRYIGCWFGELLLLITYYNMNKQPQEEFIKTNGTSELNSAEWFESSQHRLRFLEIKIRSDGSLRGASIRLICDIIYSLLIQSRAALFHVFCRETQRLVDFAPNVGEMSRKRRQL